MSSGIYPECLESFDRLCNTWKLQGSATSILNWNHATTGQACFKANTVLSLSRQKCKTAPQRHLVHFPLHMYMYTVCILLVFNNGIVRGTTLMAHNRFLVFYFIYLFTSYVTTSSIMVGRKPDKAGGNLMTIFWLILQLTDGEASMIWNRGHFHNTA